MDEASGGPCGDSKTDGHPESGAKHHFASADDVVEASTDHGGYP